MKYIGTEDQTRHIPFVRIEDSKICELISENEFSARGVKDFVDYL